MTPHRELILGFDQAARADVENRRIEMFRQEQARTRVRECRIRQRKTLLEHANGEGQ